MKKNILFVCIENSCRSQIAEAFAKIHGAEKVNAYSSGSKPSGIVNPKAIESMKQLGYDLSSHDSKSLQQIPQIEYDVVITMGCGDACPFVRGKKRIDWQIPDPKNMPLEEFRKIRDEIESKVRDLLAQFYSISTFNE